MCQWLRIAQAINSAARRGSLRMDDDIANQLQLTQLYTSMIAVHTSIIGMGNICKNVRQLGIPKQFNMEPSISSIANSFGSTVISFDRSLSLHRFKGGVKLNTIIKSWHLKKRLSISHHGIASIISITTPIIQKLLNPTNLCNSNTSDCHIFFLIFININ
ncbi:hypothetical protein Xbud_00249 [Xenorhabdus budapestensis]|uniref:Uncharacterized protein n=1 Tax=Xenorhabdus budapestensis TaxID=290110 RepID=A0A2D0J5C4_XENBU|nr:hypothetical protein Xbud_00249 [Xenorhabdus budapestensis]